MNRLVGLGLLVSGLRAACASTGYYSRVDSVYSNSALGFHLTLPPPWVVYTSPEEFRVPLQLRPNQEWVLEAHHPPTQLGLVLVVQQGSLADIATLVKKMQATSDENLAKQLARADGMDFRQLAVRQIMVNGRATAEWVYTVTDRTGGSPLEVTVSYYITKVAEQYVYLTFSVPSAQYPGARRTIESTLATFSVPQSRRS
jgi:hypothetical protein